MDQDKIQIGEMILSLDEARETLHAIHAGKVDAVVVQDLGGGQVFTFRDSSHPYRLLVEAMGEGAVLTTLDGLICYQNPCFSALVGMDKPPMGNRALSEHVTPAGRPALAALLDRVRTSEPARGDVELIGTSGRPVPVQLSVSRALLLDVAVFSIVVTDLTEQRRQEELYRAARLEVEARDRLFSVASHELRNPLTILELQTQLLDRLLQKVLQGTPLPVARAIEMVEKINAQSTQLSALISNLLDVGTLGAGRLRLSPQSLDLAEVVRAVVDDAREQIRRSGSSITLDLHSVRGEWDRVRIEQVIGNLISNAVKYGLGRPIRISVEKRRGIARLIVSDQGRGILVEARERIFRPYERLEETGSAPGLGLGLYICAEIVKSHDGTIRAEGNPGGGSLFIVELPLDRAALLDP